MREGFLARFIGLGQYQQNSCLSVKEFIEYCKKRGIETNEHELEFLEKEGLFYPLIRIDRPIGEEEWIKITNKEGKSYSRPAEDGLKEDERENERYIQRYYSEYYFNNRYIELLLGWINEGVLFDPSTRPFQEWSKFKGEVLRFNDNKIISLYISYQIYWLDILKKNYSMNIDLSSGKLILSSSINGGYYNDVSKGTWELNNFEDLFDKFKAICDDECFKNYFNIDIKKLKLKAKLQEFNYILEFLVGIQNIYAPYGRSGSKNMQLIQDPFDSDTWHERRKIFDPKKELESLNMDIKTVSYYYQVFSKKSIDLLGGGDANDWIQLWKSVRWYKKELLNGRLRLGIEYLQWALMLKRFIEDYRENETLDVDEVIRTEPNYALECDPYKVDSPFNLRSSRNRRLSDENNNYYDDIYKRLFYLVNDFGLDYQPRVIVFVEGATEEAILPKFFEWYYGKMELGIEILNFRGVDKLLSTSNTAKDLRNLIHDIQKDLRDKAIPSYHEKKLNKLIKKLENVDIVISNWTSFISFNLEKWQIIPVFVSDNESNIKHFLDAEKPIRFNNRNYNVPSDWKFLWGINNDNKPLKGYSFELANYTNEEIAQAISEVLKDKIETDSIMSLRENCYSINRIDERIRLPENKTRINQKLYENLFIKYKETEDTSIFERPVFRLVEKLYNIAELNHLPVDRTVEMENKKRIVEILTEKNHKIKR